MCNHGLPEEIGNMLATGFIMAIVKVWGGGFFAKGIWRKKEKSKKIILIFIPLPTSFLFFFFSSLINTYICL